MKHHITVNDIPLCEVKDIRGDVACNHLTEVRAKTALLRLIENNPMLPIIWLEIKPGVCGEVRKIYGGRV